MLKRMISDQREGRLPGGERAIMGRRHAREEHHNRQDDPEERPEWSANPINDHGTPSMNPSGGSSLRRGVQWRPVPSALGAQHRHRPEHDPEAVRDVGDLDHPDSQGPSPTAPRRALRNQTDRKERCDTSRWARGLWPRSPSAMPRRRAHFAASAPGWLPASHRPPSRWRYRGRGRGSPVSYALRRALVRLELESQGAVNGGEASRVGQRDSQTSMGFERARRPSVDRASARSSSPARLF